MSFIGDAMKTIESVILLRSKVDQLDQELMRTNDDLRRVIGHCCADERSPHPTGNV